MRRSPGCRSRLPRRAGPPPLFAAATGGATIVREDGVDFTALEPALLALVARLGGLTRPLRRVGAVVVPVAPD